MHNVHFVCTFINRVKPKCTIVWKRNLFRCYVLCVNWFKNGACLVWNEFQCYLPSWTFFVSFSLHVLFHSIRECNSSWWHDRQCLLNMLSTFKIDKSSNWVCAHTYRKCVSFVSYDLSLFPTTFYFTHLSIFDHRRPYQTILFHIRLIQWYSKNLFNSAINILRSYESRESYQKYKAYMKYLRNLELNPHYYLIILDHCYKVSRLWHNSISLHVCVCFVPLCFSVCISYNW